MWGEVQFFDYEILSAREMMKSMKDHKWSVNKASYEFESAGYSSFSTALAVSIKLL